MRRAAWRVPMRASSWTLVVPQGGFLRFASAAADLTPSLTRRLRSLHPRARGRAPPLGHGLEDAGFPALCRPAEAGAPSRQHRRRPVLPAVLRQQLPTAARAVVSMNPSLHRDDAFELSQLALAEPPRRGVHGRRQFGQRARRRSPASQASPRHRAVVWMPRCRRRGGTRRCRVASCPL